MLYALVSISFVGTKRDLITYHLSQDPLYSPSAEGHRGREVKVEALHLMFVGWAVPRNQVKEKDTYPWARAWALWLPPAPTTHSSSLLISNSVGLLSLFLRWLSSSPPSLVHCLMTLLRDCLTSYLVAPSSDWCPALLPSQSSWSTLIVCHLSVFIQTL